MKRKIVVSLTVLAGLVGASIGFTSLHAHQHVAQTSIVSKPFAYFIAEYEITDREGMKPYSAKVESTFKPFGGRFIVRGRQITSLEGAPVKGGIVIIAFDNVDKAKAWYHSPAYGAIRPFRWRSAKTRAFIVEGTSHDARPMPATNP
jgi:uncharacterized protein (DUF1330 family)